MLHWTPLVHADDSSAGVGDGVGGNVAIIIVPHRCQAPMPIIPWLLGELCVQYNNLVVRKKKVNQAEQIRTLG